MLNKFLIAAAIVFASPSFIFADDIFFAFGQGAAATDTSSATTADGSGSVYIFSDLNFAFDAADLDFTVSDGSVVELTGGQGFNPTFNLIGDTRFDSSVVSRDEVLDANGNPLLDASGAPIESTTDGRFLGINITQNGVNPALSPTFDPGFDSAVGVDGAVLLARVDYNIVGAGTTTFDLFLNPDTVAPVILLDDSEPDGTLVLNPTLGSGTLTVGPAAIIPEPSSLTLLLLGSVGLVARRKRA